MATKLNKETRAAPPGETPLTGAVRDSAQQIWQAGLGAFHKAQAEGSKAFEALVKEGMALQRKTQSVAEEKLSEASSRMSSMASDISSKAVGQWDRLESIFEDRVAKALNKLGAPSAKDVDALVARIDELDKRVQQLAARSVAPRTASKAGSKPAPRKATVKTPSRRAARSKTTDDGSPA